MTVALADEFQPDEVLTDDPVNGPDANQHYFTFGSPKYQVRVPAGVPFREAGCYRKFTGECLGTATALVTRENGRRAVILGNAGFDTKFLSSARCRMLYAAADWASGNALPALPADAAQLMLFPHVLPDGSLKSVLVLNSNIFASGSVTLRLRSVPETQQSVQWHIPAEEPRTLEVTPCGNTVQVTLPPLQAWQGGWLQL